MSDTAPLPRRLLHLAVAAEWERARARRTYERSTIDTSLEEEGFIHCSFPDQVQATADRYYRGRDDIVLLRIDPDRLDPGVEVVVEAARSGERFPHVYGPIPVDAVTSVEPVPIGADGRLDLGWVSG
jgi:glutathione S-transferase